MGRREKKREITEVLDGATDGVAPPEKEAEEN